MGFFSDLYNKAKRKLYDWENPVAQRASSNLGQIYSSAKNFLGNTERNIGDYFKPAVDFAQKYPSVLDYTQKVIMPKVQDYFSQPEKVAKDVFMNTSAFGAADKLMNDWRSPAADYFKPTEKVRTRDFVREAPQATFEAAKQIPQFATRFAISAVETPKAIRTGQATKKYYNTPFGRLNSFQSEAQNRVERGDPLWKSIAYPAAKTVLGAADAMAAAKPILGAAKSLSKFGSVGKEVSNIAEDLTAPITKAPMDFQSKTMKSMQSPGLTIKDISPEAAARRAAYNERQAASAEKAKQLVAKQMENQRQGLETAEPGFVSPKVVKAPEKPVLEQPQAPAPKQSTLPGIEEYVNGKTEPKPNPVFSSEDPFKGNAFGEPNGGKPYNVFQQRAYQAKQERVGALKEIATEPRELRAGGFRKAEIERMGVDEAKKKANLLKLGYPKDEILKMDIDRMKLILKRGVPHETLKNYYQRKHALDTNYLEGVDPTTLKDINPVNTGIRDVYRNSEVAFGQNFPKIKSQLLDPFDAAKGNMFSELQQLTDEVFGGVVNKFGIKKGSELDHAVVAYGEGKIKLPELQELYPNDWKKITAADEWFRNKYPQLLADLNAVREENFPTHPLFPESTKIIPQRADYYRHGKDLEGYKGLLNMFETPAGIDPALAATSEFTKPKTKWLSFAQKRKGDENDLGAVQGYLDYIKNHSYAKHIDPFIQKFQGVDAEVAKEAQKTKQYFHQTRGLVEELSQKLDPVQQIADSVDPSEIKNILVDKGVSDLQANWMSKELASVHDLEKTRTFLKEKLAKNSGKQLENLNTAMAPAEKSDNKLNSFLKFLDNFSNDLAGKTNPFDRPVQDFVGRRGFRIVKSLNSHVKANIIVGNIASGVAQAGNVPQGLAHAGAKSSFVGMRDSLASIFRKNIPMESSTFIRERFFHGFNKFDTGVLANTKKFAVWITGVLDEAGTKVIWNSIYKKALNEKILNPIKYADDWTRKMVQGRGIGEVPILQKANMTKLLAPFQLEVQGLWHVFHDWKLEGKLFPKFVKFAIASYLYNEMAEKIRGSRVSFDPINAGKDAWNLYQNEDNKIMGGAMAGGRMAGEVLKNVMGGPTLASTILSPETSKKYLGDADPNRFGSGLGVVLGSGLLQGDLSTKRGWIKTGMDLASKTLLPYGGSQVKKTIEGIDALRKGFVENATGKVMTPVNRGVTNVMKGVLFGKNALSEMRDYFDNNGTPLSDQQTEKYKLMGNDVGFFNKLMAEKKSNNEKDALKGVKAPGETKNLSDDMSQLSSGSFYVKSLDKEFKTEEKAKTAIALDEFVNSDKKSMELDGRFYFKNPNTEQGYSSTTISARDKTLATSSANLEMDRAIANKDLKTWISAADKKLKSLDDYLGTLDPAIDQDEIDRITLEKENLIDTAKKYAGYGGFKKGASGSSIASKALTLSSAKLTTLKAKGDYKGWMAAAGSQLNMLQNMANDPNASELQRARAESRIATLEKQRETYGEYGGFKKTANEEIQIAKEERANKRQIAKEERAAARAKANQTTDVKWRYPLVDPEMLKINALIQGTGNRKMTIGKKVLPLIVRRPPAVHRRSVRKKK